MDVSYFLPAFPTLRRKNRLSMGMCQLLAAGGASRAMSTSTDKALILHEMTRLSLFFHGDSGLSLHTEPFFSSFGTCVSNRACLKVCGPWGKYFGSNNPIYLTSASLLPSFSPASLTMANNLHTVSLGCAPTPNQYFARLTSILISLTFRSPGSAPTGVCGIGLYVPSTSIGLESRADRAWARTIWRSG
jgi:hypothetical protein